MYIVNLIKRSLTTKLLIAVLVFSFAVPINYQLGVTRAEAASVGGQLVTIVQDLSPTGNTNMAANTAQTAKDGFIDGFFHLAAKVFLRAMVRSIIQWINSGFQGAPAFVTDLQGFLVDVADEIAGEFIYQSDALNFLCSPFELDVRIALAGTYSEGRTNNYQPQCTLTDVVDNVENFLDGGFEDGGWPGWVELSLSEDSNPQKAYFNASAEMYARIITAQGEEIQLLDFGDGFFSLETCDVAELGTSAAPNCTIGTPGSIIANSINKALGAEQDVLITADEVNEVFNALIMQIFRQVFQGAFGLLGLGGNASYTNYNWDTSDTYSSSTSILDAQEIYDQNITVDPSGLGSMAPITQAIDDEEDYLSVQYDIIGRVDAAENDYNAASSCTFSFPTELSDVRSTAVAEVALSTLILVDLYDFEDRFASSTSATEQQNVLQEFYDYLNVTLTHNQSDVATAQLFMEYDLQLEIEDLNDRIADDCS